MEIIEVSLPTIKRRQILIKNHYSLISVRILSLVAYILLLVMIGWKIFRNLAQNFSRLNMAALMIFLMWLVDTIGLVPSLYPGYQWYVWGFIGLAFRGIEGLNEKAGS